MSWRDSTTGGSMKMTINISPYPSHIEDAWTQDMLATIPDDVLTAECRRRGLEVRR